MKFGILRATAIAEQTLIYRPSLFLFSFEGCGGGVAVDNSGISTHFIFSSNDAKTERDTKRRS